MAIKPSGFSAVSGDIDWEGNGLEGAVCANEVEARQSLADAFAEFVRKATEGTYLRYFYGDGPERKSTFSPIPEPPEGYITVVSQGSDHNGGESERFYAIPRGSRLRPRYRRTPPDDFKIEKRGGVLWDSWFDEPNLVFPLGAVEFHRETFEWTPVEDWRHQQED